MSINSGYMHISLDELVELKIPALNGREAENNIEILRSVALRGPMLKYDIFKSSGIGYASTVSRRVDRLVERKYLIETGTRVIKRGKRTEESEYGLTWRGFIASIALNEVRVNSLQVLKIHPLLTFPEKELVLPILEEFVTQKEVEMLAKSMLEAYLKTISSLELVSCEPMTVLTSLSSVRENPFSEGFKLSKMPENADQLLKLIDKPAIFNAIKKRLVPLVNQVTEQTEVLFRFLVIFNDLGKYISTLEVEDQPSKKIVEYAKTNLVPKLSELSDLSTALEERVSENVEGG